MGELHDDIARRLQALDVAWTAMNGFQTPGSGDNDTLAAEWVDSLRGVGKQDGDGAAFQLLRYLVPEAEARTAGFWSSALGRAIARYGWITVNEAGQVPAVIVGAIMGFTRSRAHELQSRGRLCTPAQVAAALREREAVRTDG
jgi:hypothetical protein